LVRQKARKEERSADALTRSGDVFACLAFLVRVQEGTPPMNQQSYNNRNQQQNGRYQQNNNRFQQDPNRYKRQDLERELRQLNRRLTELDGQIDALFFQGQQLEADLFAHNQAIPATIAMEIGRALANAIHVPFLPAMYRNWHYKREAMLQAQNRLKYRAIELKFQRDALEQQIGQTETDIEMLQYS
jgi:predicted  nucleic acid-binding Zn-ribbon protein